MSFEAGRKFGLTASLIAVILPVVTVVLYGLLIISLILSFASSVSGGSSLSSASFFSIGLFGAFIAIAVLSVVGIILFLLATHRLSRYYDEPSIFKNALYGFLTNIIGTFALIVIAVALIFAETTSAISSTPTSSGSGFTASIFGIIVAFYVVGIIAAVFYMRSFNKLGDNSGIQNFNTAGLLYLIGTVIPLIGALLLWIAWIFALTAFNSLKPKASTPSPSTAFYSAPQPTATAAVGKRFCVYCGEEISSDSDFCQHCGRPVQK